MRRRQKNQNTSVRGPAFMPALFISTCFLHSFLLLFEYFTFPPKPAQAGRGTISMT